MAMFTRRAAIGAAAAASLPLPVLARTGRAPDVIVVGAGVFGAWTARHLQRMGERVTLVDAWGPAHARASSGGESRMTRGAYGADEIYTRMAHDSLPEWKALSRRAGLPLFHRIGVLHYFTRRIPFVDETLAVHRRLGLPTRTLGQAEMQRLWPQIDFSGVAIGLHEPDFGALMARRAVQSVVAEFVAAGGTYRQAQVSPPAPADGPLATIELAGGERLAAGRFVFACGPWLPKVFPEMLGGRIFPTRQEIFFFAPPPGDDRFAPGRLPGWTDFDGDDIFYGFPDLESRGFKIAYDPHGPPIDPDTGDRSHSASGLANVRAFIRRRFPAMADRPLNETRVCQYENSANGDLLIDFHQRLRNVLLVGAGSGHGFKHGPAVGAYAARLLSGRVSRQEPRFSLASKSEVQNRAVH